jgi:hypothetical protein
VNFKELNMSFQTRDFTEPAIDGQSIQLAENHVVAMYSRNGQAWVAVFVDGHGELMDPGSWFRSRYGMPFMSKSLRRIAMHDATPLSASMIERIERLHRQSEGTARHTSELSAMSWWRWVMELWNRAARI